MQEKQQAGYQQHASTSGGLLRTYGTIAEGLLNRNPAVGPLILVLFVSATLSLTAHQLSMSVLQEIGEICVALTLVPWAILELGFLFARRRIEMQVQHNRPEKTITKAPAPKELESGDQGNFVEGGSTESRK